MGRHSTFTPELAAEICERLSDGEPLASICADDHMPAVRTVSDWKRADEAFAADFACARDEGFDALAAECLDIADDTEGDASRENPESVQRAKLRIETRLKLLAKWDPRRYGEALNLNHSGEVTNFVARIPAKAPDASSWLSTASGNLNPDPKPTS